MREFESFERIGVTPHRSYYIPFDTDDTVEEKHGIIDRTSSSRFISLDGVWKIRELTSPDELDLAEELAEKIEVPSSVQMKGYDRIQYLNTRYPFPVMLPKVPKKNPSWHYRREFELKKLDTERYYLNFEGVDCSFYLYVNGAFKGYSQIAHATSEFEITELLKDGKNTIDVLVLKWSVSTYLECQDKFRLSGIFRSVYLLRRPTEHITDYKTETRLTDGGGILRIANESAVDINAEICGRAFSVKAGEQGEISLENITPWTAEAPTLYPLRLSACGEIIEERIGFREIEIDGCVLKLNGEAFKLKGVNRHEFSPDGGAAVTLAEMERDLALMKELNVNAIRTSHYPDSPEFYLLCDRYGFYVMDEADLEMHGACTREGTYDFKLWREYGENELLAPGILDRHSALVERDKNRTSVIIWSLGNESSFGRAFFDGAAYIRSRDKTRPIHYESLQQADEKYYFSDAVDFVSMMYPSIGTIKERVLDNPEEKRPFIMCEYTHAMGNSCGDIADYWKLIYENEQMAGAFVWEWADHAVRSERGFLYGGDFGEEEHDGNFCVDGLVTPDRLPKSSALEMKAVYGGKLYSGVKDIPFPVKKTAPVSEKLHIKVDEDTGELTSVKLGTRELLKTPMHFNLMRYTDNERDLVGYRSDVLRLSNCRSHVTELEVLKNGYKIDGVLAANCMTPALSYHLEYLTSDNELTVKVGYEIADYVKRLPRFGIEFGVDKRYSRFSYVGYGPTESYVDKHVAAEYGYYESEAEKNYDMKYIRPQESGSHYATKYLCVDGLFTLTADLPFSQSVTPYTTEQLINTQHNFELPENDFVNVSVDLAMRGVGSHSCGPELSGEYEIPRRGENTFIFTFEQ